MKMGIHKLLALLVLVVMPVSVYAAGIDVSAPVEKETNWSAISMFIVFVGATLYITYWAAQRTKAA